MKYRALIVALLAFCMSALVACSSAPADTTVATTELLTYDEIRGTGLANNCPSLAETSRGSIPIEAGGTYKLSWFVFAAHNLFCEGRTSKQTPRGGICAW
jgi:photosystem II oxygen-evolving enhancer protein 1